MNPKDYFNYALSNIRHRQLRSWLTMIGIFVGIAAVVALVSLGQGLQKYIDDEAQSLGSNKILILPKGQFGAPGSGSGAVILTENDFDVVKKTPGVTLATRLVIANAGIEFAKGQIFHMVFGIPYDSSYHLISDLGYKVVEGRDLKSTDQFNAVLGADYFDRNVFDKNVKVGDTVLINSMPFKVVGRFQRIGNPDDDKNVFININTFRKAFPQLNDEVDEIYLQVADSAQIETVQERITKELDNFRNLKKGQEDFTVQTPEQLLATFSTIFAIVQAVIVGIAGISLIVGGIGITNTMYTAILERTKEIGVMKAIGAKNGNILLLFMIEAGTLGFVGGVIGIVLGMGIAKGVEIIAANALGSALFQAYFPWYLIVGALAFAFIIGAVSGVLPALQASRQKPVESLRYE